jgi:hypothetical protein
MTTRPTLLIDAFNVIFAHPRLGPLVRRDAERAREEFLVLVAGRAAGGGRRVIVVFDAHRDPGPVATPGRIGAVQRHGVEAVFARETADTWIREHIRNAPDARAITVVTSDREILATARDHGCTVLRVADFLQLGRRGSKHRREPDSDKPGRASAREVAEWERLFGSPRAEDDEKP